MALREGTLNLIYGVNLPIEEAWDMEDLVLVGNIRGKNPNKEEMELWVQKNWMGLIQAEPEVDTLSKGWFGFTFNNKEEAGNILNQN